MASGLSAVSPVFIHDVAVFEHTVISREYVKTLAY